jgi:hypothetical protein
MTFDIFRILSTILAILTFVIVLKFWKIYPKFHPQFFLVLTYLIHGIVYYIVLLITHLSPLQIVTDPVLNDWGAVLRFHSYTTWFFVALLFLRSRGFSNGH